MLRPVGSTGSLYDPCLARELLHLQQRKSLFSWSSLGHCICAFGYVLIYFWLRCSLADLRPSAAGGVYDIVVYSVG